mmetsp:Transcript_98170/g.219988  ORF Transcript_98170/g.219988 Transcript_98170/m.219988 type:complete len:307 (+) Transcript_98170:629-1549(+)
MRKQMPSSVHFSKTGLEDSREVFNCSASALKSGRGSNATFGGAAFGVERPRASSTLEVHEKGKSRPASPAMKDALRKCSLRCLRTSRSFRSKPFSASPYAAMVSGGTNSSPSLRLSERQGLKTSFKKPLSSFPSEELSTFSICGQKALPTAVRSSKFSLKAIGPSRAETGVSVRLKLSRLRSTPRKGIVAVIVGMLNRLGWSGKPGRAEIAAPGATKLFLAVITPEGAMKLRRADKELDGATKPRRAVKAPEGTWKPRIPAKLLLGWKPMRGGMKPRRAWIAPEAPKPPAAIGATRNRFRPNCTPP